MFAGDSLSMPVHGYYNRMTLMRDYGRLAHYVAPRLPHPESNLFRTKFENSPNADILHERAATWKQPGTHYHNDLKAGENTLILLLARELAQSLADCRRYDREDYIRRFLDLMLVAGRHHDTYIPEALRVFFSNYASNKPPLECGAESNHAAGLCLVLPILLLFSGAPAQAKALAREHLHLTHRGEAMASASDLLADIVSLLIQGQTLDYVIYERMGMDRHPALAYPFRRWIEHRTDEDVAAHELRSGPLLSDALPLSIYLCLKYQGNTREALIANANLGGDNCHRGAVIGAILGAVNGLMKLPEEFIRELADHDLLQSLGERLWNLRKEQPGIPAKA